MIFAVVYLGKHVNLFSKYSFFLVPHMKKFYYFTIWRN